MRQVLSERDIERTCSDWLALDGWRLIKTDSCSDRARAKGFGEIGMADCLYIRYESKQRENDSVRRTWAVVMWIEWKSPRGKLSGKQKEWHRAERARGALTLAAGCSFPPTIEGFQEWYRSSRLMLKKI